MAVTAPVTARTMMRTTTQPTSLAFFFWVPAGTMASEANPAGVAQRHSSGLLVAIRDRHSYGAGRSARLMLDPSRGA